MKFGRLDHIESIDFSLPKDHPHTTTLLSRQPRQEPKIMIGCPVWADKGYVGTLYPQRTKPQDFLYHYSRQFNAIELNSTHYHIPRPETVIKWREAVPEYFLFSPKFPQYISHRKDLMEGGELLEVFLERVFDLNPKLGMSFLQLPPYFKPERLNNLFQFLSHLPTDFELAVELRHEAWFADAVVREEAFSMLETVGATAVITDVAGRRDVLHQRLTSGTAFIRFTGNNLHKSDYQRIDAWVLRIESWLKQGLHTLYFYLHEPEKALCADLARYLILKMQERGLPAPQAPKLISPEATQGTLF